MLNWAFGSVSHEHGFGGWEVVFDNIIMLNCYLGLSVFGFPGKLLEILEFSRDSSY